MNKKGFVYYNLVGLKVLFQIKRKSMCLYCLLQLIHGLSYVAQVFLLQRFYDSITAYDSAADKYGIVVNLLLMALSFLLAQIMNGVANSYGQILNEALQKGLNGILYKRIALMDSVEFEHPQKLDMINKAVNGSQTIFWVSTALLDIVFFYCSYFGMMSCYLFSMQPLLAVSVILVFIPNVISYFIHMISFRRLENQIAPMRRKTTSFLGYMTGKEYVKETRHLGLYHFFCERYESTLRKINELNMKLHYRKGFIDLIVCTMTVLFYGGIIFMLYRYAVINQITPGTFAAVLLSLKQFYGFMYELIEERFAWASQNVISIENYLKCIEGYHDGKESCHYDKGMNIALKNVCFSYPSSTKYALDHVDLTIPYGQTIALVGENGSGKSTLCSVLEGLYSPDQGDIVFQQKDAGELSVKGKRRTGISAVFQKFVQYRMSIRDNITIGDVEKDSTDQDVEKICTDVDIHLDQEGIDAMLGRDFDGRELSGGQWQRVAIARGIYRDCDLIIMDEPTSAIDPVEESRLFEKIYEYSREKTAIIVTHRMALAKLADRVLVMKNGKIVQDGTHEQLMQKEGEYKKLYQMQMKWYMESDLLQSSNVTA